MRLKVQIEADCNPFYIEEIDIRQGQWKYIDLANWPTEDLEKALQNENFVRIAIGWEKKQAGQGVDFLEEQARAMAAATFEKIRRHLQPRIVWEHMKENHSGYLRGEGVKINDKKT